MQTHPFPFFSIAPQWNQSAEEHNAAVVEVGHWRHWGTWPPPWSLCIHTNLTIFSFAFYYRLFMLKLIMWILPDFVNMHAVSPGWAGSNSRRGHWSRGTTGVAKTICGLSSANCSISFDDFVQCFHLVWNTINPPITGHVADRTSLTHLECRDTRIFTYGNSRISVRKNIISRIFSPEVMHNFVLQLSSNIIILYKNA